MVLDFETRFDKTCSVVKQQTVRYITDPKFKVLSVATNIEGKIVCVTQSQVTDRINDLRRKYGSNLERCTLVCHNAYFDCSILSLAFGIVPRNILDTRFIDMHLEPDEDHSLSAICDRWKIPYIKGSMKRFEGMDFAFEFLWEELRQDNENDVKSTRLVLDKLLPRVTCPEHELYIMSHTVQLGLQARLKLDVPLATEIVKHLQLSLAKIIAETGYSLREINSDYFETLFLAALGDEAPAYRTGKSGDILAISKKDPEALQYFHHPKPEVSRLVAARSAAKAYPLHIKRINRFLEMATSLAGGLVVPLHYCGASTGRFSGADGINYQNLVKRSVVERAAELRECIQAPEGYSIFSADQEQGEARIAAWLGGETSLLEDFRLKRDPYSKLASRIAGTQIRKPKDDDPPDLYKFMDSWRQCGKCCLGEGTLVLCRHGNKIYKIPIEQITKEEEVWDGMEWVKHQGLIFNGIKTTLSLCGSWLTPDHQVWTGSVWVRNDELQDVSLRQALATASVNLPLQEQFGDPKAGYLKYLSAVTATIGNILLMPVIFVKVLASAVLNVQPERDTASGIGNTSLRYPMTPTEHGCSIDLALLLPDVITQETRSMPITENAASVCGVLGEKIGPSFWRIYRQFLVGIIRVLTWTGQITVAAMNRVTFALSLRQSTPKIDDLLRNLKRKLPVYDLACCGPNNRFTILTSKGPLLVHNCVLGAGFGEGEARLYEILDTYPEVDKNLLTHELTAKLIDTFRREHPGIVKCWYGLQEAIFQAIECPNVLLPWNRFKLCVYPWFEGTRLSIQLPSGRRLFFNDPKVTGNERKQLHLDDKKCWGGKIFENLVQAISRDLMAHKFQELEKSGLPVVYHIHDSVACIVLDASMDEAKAKMKEILCGPLSWTEGLPFDWEIKVSKHFS